MKAALPRRFTHVGKGARWQELDTPCLIVDLDLLEANIRKMSAFLADQKTHCRPHFKAHMCPGIAAKQIESGAIGLCAAKVSAAAVLVDHGLENVLLANQVVGPVKIRELLRLRERSNIMVVADDADNVRGLSEASVAARTSLGVLAEVRVRSDDSTFARGYTRNGVDRPEGILALARQIDRSPGLRFEGLMGYEGPHPKIKDEGERKAAILRDMKPLFDSIDMLKENGIECRIVSAGGTGTYSVTGALQCVTELQPGSYVLMNTVKKRYCKDFDQSLFLASMVTGRPEPDTVILDVGMKSLKMSKQDTTDDDVDRPPVISVSGAALHHLSEEHAAVKVTGEARQLRPGDKVLIAPSYGAPTINYHDCMYGVRDGVVEEIWPVAARGCSQ